jgi:hypothetical protein
LGELVEAVLPQRLLALQELERLVFLEVVGEAVS